MEKAAHLGHSILPLEGAKIFQKFLLYVWRVGKEEVLLLSCFIVSMWLQGCRKRIFLYQLTSTGLAFET